MAFQATTGLGVAVKINVAGNSPVPHPGSAAVVTMSLTGANGWPTTFQLNPQVVDVANNAVPLGTALVLTSVAASVPGTLVLSASAATAGGNTVLTGTITGGGSSALEGYTVIVAGFTNAANNGQFQVVASTTTTLTVNNAAGVAETHAATAAFQEGTAVYTGTITGGGSSALAGQTFVVAGFVTNLSNNGTFIATASTTTTLTLANFNAIAETHAATATSEETTNQITYVVYPSKTNTGGTYLPVNNGATAIATISATGLLTAVAKGAAVGEISFPFANNSEGNIVSTGNPMNGLPKDKIYKEVNIHVVA